MLIPGGQRQYEFVDPEATGGGHRRRWYWLEEWARSGERTVRGPRGLELPAAASVMALWPGAPNPFAVATTLPFQLDCSSSVSLEIYAADGRLVRRLIDRELRGQGAQAATWDGTDSQGRRLSSGVYFCLLRAGGETASSKLQIAR
jgi:hypothetical protein